MGVKTRLPSKYRELRPFGRRLVDKEPAWRRGPSYFICFKFMGTYDQGRLQMFLYQKQNQNSYEHLKELGMVSHCDKRAPRIIKIQTI
eukprot:954732-Amphidinium_carterae.1